MRLIPQTRASTKQLKQDIRGLDQFLAQHGVAVHLFVYAQRRARRGVMAKSRMPFRVLSRKLVQERGRAMQGQHLIVPRPAGSQDGRGSLELQEVMSHLGQHEVADGAQELEAAASRLRPLLSRAEEMRARRTYRADHDPERGGLSSSKSSATFNRTCLGSITCQLLCHTIIAMGFAISKIHGAGV